MFEEEGVDPARVVIGHADSFPSLDHYLEIIGRGANVEFDFLGMSFSAVERLGEPRIAGLVMELIARGHADRVLLSQDVCHNSQLKHYEGNGYVHLHESFLPRLRAAGASEADITQHHRHEPGPDPDRRLRARRLRRRRGSPSRSG